MVTSARTLVAVLLLAALPCMAGEGTEMLLDSNPAGAQVEQAGQVIGRTPLRLSFAKGYFETRQTSYGTFLGAPLEFTLTLDGFQPKVVKLGRGPFPWQNMLGQVVYQYYLLDHSYVIELTPAEAGSGLNLGELERLAALREKGLLTDEEFREAKQRILAKPSANAVTAPANPLEGATKEALCTRMMDRSFDAAGMAKLLSAGRQATSAPDGGDRQVVLGCLWEVMAPVPARIELQVVCADKPEPAATLCASSGQAPSSDNPACLWGTANQAKAATRYGCAMQGSILYDARRVSASNSLVAPLDARELLRSMAGRI